MSGRVPGPLFSPLLSPYLLHHSLLPGAPRPGSLLSSILPLSLQPVSRARGNILIRNGEKKKFLAEKL